MSHGPGQERSRRPSRFSLLSVALALVAFGLFARSILLAADATDSAPPDADAKATAAQIWDTRCAACHGQEGRGDGPGAASLQPKPVNFHNRNWQRAVSNDQIAKAIVEGGGAVGLSNQMAANPDLEDEPAVVKALVIRVREFGKQS